MNCNEQQTLAVLRKLQMLTIKLAIKADIFKRNKSKSAHLCLCMSELRAVLCETCKSCEMCYDAICKTADHLRKEHR